MTTQNIGIDYGLGRSNIDKQTGIRFGVIASNSLSPDAMDDCWQNARDLSFEHAQAEAKSEIDRLETESELAEWLTEHLYIHRDAAQWAHEILESYTTDDGEILTAERSEVTAHVWNEVEQEWNDAYGMADCGERDWLYESDGYKLTNCLQSDVMVIASPYFTYAQFCSPCVPGACNLDSPINVIAADGLPMPSSLVMHDRCYCLGHDWFDGNKAPYPVYSVETGELVQP